MCDLINSSVGVPYICSLSSESDLLSQWRAYGQNGAGVAIGLKCASLPSSERMPLLTYVKKNSVALRKIFYEEAEQEKIIEHILAPVFENSEINDEDSVVMSNAASLLAGLCVIFKNPAFSEEKEWRIVHRPLIMANNNNPFESKIYQSISSPKYRISGGRLVTYFEYDFEELEPNEIFSEIVLGPKSEVSDYDLSIFLTENNLANLVVRRSKASYR